MGQGQRQVLECVIVVGGCINVLSGFYTVVVFCLSPTHTTITVLVMVTCLGSMTVLMFCADMYTVTVVMLLGVM